MKKDNNREVSADAFNWCKLHIDQTLMLMTVRNGSDSLKWKYILLMFYYLKDGTNMTYEKACMVIGKQHLDKIIKYQDVIKEDEFIKMPLADNNWETYTKTKKGNSKGGLKKAENQRKRAKYRLCDLTPTNLRKMSEEERAEVNHLFNLDDLDYS
tara:strand:+ start:495 stop:959 length:465 start_codon:yes stop_codon:yes gene_type:complete